MSSGLWHERDVGLDGSSRTGKERRVSEEDRVREARLTRVAHAAGFGSVSVFISVQPHGSQPERSHVYSGFGGKWEPDVFVASWLTDPEAEATVLHELAHIELGHDDDPTYQEAEVADRAAMTDRYRGPWELEADALAAAMTVSIGSDMTDLDASLAWLFDDVNRFG